MSEYKIKIYVDHGYYQYTVTSKDQAMAHGQTIMSSQVYRRVNENGDVEFHHVHKVKVCGEDLGSQYNDTFIRT